MKGVHAAIVTHFDTDLAVDQDAIAAEVRRLIADGIHGIVPNGTVGEGGTLSRDERRTLVETAVGAAAGQAPVCVGVSAPTAEQAAAYARDARDAGADAVMTLPPLLYRADRRELVEFFGTDARRIAHLVNLCPELDVLVGGDDWALEGLCAGATGWVSGVADVFGAECVRLWELCQAGELAAARALYADLLPLARLDMTPKLVQYFKAALDEIGVGGGPCRPPRLPLGEDELATLRRAVAQASQARTASR
jgi:4-hydroxy-tetrahydrodipicolinate synthase